ncbi:eukaryotic translation initiation factor 5 [Cricetulus griseus]
MSVNVNRSVSDQFYRYKMPRLIAKVEGKGNGIKTVIVNMVDVAKALNRPPTYPTKYFGCELGAQTQFDVKNDRYIVNGSHEANKLQDMLDGFIKKFVLCPECENPETDLFCHNNKKAQRYLLHGLECVVAMHQAQLISKIPHILKEMYDADLLEEEVIISWSEKVVYSKTASVPKVETVKSDNKDDDIDIDAI